MSSFLRKNNLHLIRQTLKIMEEAIEETIGIISKPNRFIEANTVESSLQEISAKHVIPVFTRFNEPLISHSDFIGITQEAIKEVFPRELFQEPSVRVSHPIKGRIPEAKNKPASELNENEKTLYYERMAFMVEIPTIFDTVEGDNISLTVGGVKAYSLDNYNSNRKDQHFKAFIGFKNSVCTNLCINTDGLMTDINVRDKSELKMMIKSLFETYDANQHLESMKRFAPIELNHAQVSKLFGRLKMFNYLPLKEQKMIHDLRLTDSQLNNVVEAYHRDPYFKHKGHGDTNLWKLFNNVTGAMKSNYIDSHLEKSAIAHHFMNNLAGALNGEDNLCSWYIN